MFLLVKDGSNCFVVGFFQMELLEEQSRVANAERESADLVYDLNIRTQVFDLTLTLSNGFIYFSFGSPCVLGVFKAKKFPLDILNPNS